MKQTFIIQRLLSVNSSMFFRCSSYEILLRALDASIHFALALKGQRIPHDSGAGSVGASSGARAVAALCAAPWPWLSATLWHQLPGHVGGG